MKANPKNFEGWTDPNGGEWIRVNVGIFKDTVWRPQDMEIDDEGKVSYNIEFFGDVVEKVAFDKMANSIIQSILYEALDDATE